MGLTISSRGKPNTGGYPHPPKAKTPRKKKAAAQAVVEPEAEKTTKATGVGKELATKLLKLEEQRAKLVILQADVAKNAKYKRMVAAQKLAVQLEAEAIALLSEGLDGETDCEGSTDEVTYKLSKASSSRTITDKEKLKLYFDAAATDEVPDPFFEVATISLGDVDTYLSKKQQSACITKTFEGKRSLKVTLIPKA